MRHMRRKEVRNMTIRKPGRLSRKGRTIVHALLAAALLLLCISGYRIYDLYFAFH